MGQYGYYTHHQQSDFKLLQLGVRYYDPETGRFTQKDPAKDGLNWYAYVEGNPLGAVDPTGLSIWGWIKDHMFTWPLAGYAVFNWAFETGPSTCQYNENNPETRMLQRTFFMWQLRRHIGQACRSGHVAGPIDQDTIPGFVHTIGQPWNGTQAQLGAFHGEWRIDGDKVCYTVKNKIGRNSFFYHMSTQVPCVGQYIWFARDRERTPGIISWGGDLWQVFKWCEPCPAGCRGVRNGGFGPGFG